MNTTDVQQTDLTLVNRREGVRDERVQTRLVDLDVEGVSGAKSASLLARHVHAIPLFRARVTRSDSERWSRFASYDRGER